MSRVTLPSMNFGFALQTAIIFLLLMGSLSIAIMKVYVSVQENSYYDAAGDRALQAAKTGLMLVEEQIDSLPNAPGGVYPANCNIGAGGPLATVVFTFNRSDASRIVTGSVPAIGAGLATTFSDFSVNVTCDSSSTAGAPGIASPMTASSAYSAASYSYPEGAGTSYIFRLTSTACNRDLATNCTGTTIQQPWLPYVERQISDTYMMIPKNN